MMMRFKVNCRGILLLLPCIAITLFFLGCKNEDKKTTSINSDQFDIFTAVGSGDLKLVQNLIRSGVDINVREPLAKCSPLALSCVYGHDKITEWLIENGADIDAQNKDRNTPLHIASFHCHEKCIALLLEGGAEVNVRNLKGETPLDIVSYPWRDDLKRHYIFIHDFFQIPLDIHRIKINRVGIAELLINNGAKLWVVGS